MRHKAALLWVLFLAGFGAPAQGQTCSPLNKTQCTAPSLEASSPCCWNTALAPAASACTQIPSGTVRRSNGYCACPAGWGIQDNGDCKLCRALGGFYVVISSTTRTCTPCLSGSFLTNRLANTQATACSACVRGSNTNGQTGQTCCAYVDAGYTVASDGTTPVKCPRDTYSTAPRSKTAAAAAGCTRCTPGTTSNGACGLKAPCTYLKAGYKLVGATPTACHAGQFASSPRLLTDPNANKCTACSPGTSTGTLTGQTTCAYVAKGYKLVSGALVKCPADTYADTDRLRTNPPAAQCTACATGYGTRGLTGRTSASACVLNSVTGRRRIIYWGSNWVGSPMPAEVAGPHPLTTTIYSISAGGIGMAVINGKAHVWGVPNNWGQGSPPPGADIASGVTLAATDFTNSMVAKADGNVIIWGAPRSSASGFVTPVSGTYVGGPITKVTLNAKNAYVLRSNNTLVRFAGSSWSSTDLGEAPAAMASGVTDIDCGDRVCLGVAGGKVYAWGMDTPQFGEESVPPAIAALDNIVKASAGYQQNSVLTSTGQVLTWGFYDQSVIPAEASSGVSAIATGDWFTLMIKDGKLLRSATIPLGPSSTLLPPTSIVEQISAGSFIGMAVVRDTV